MIKSICKFFLIGLFLFYCDIIAQGQEATHHKFHIDTARLDSAVHQELKRSLLPIPVLASAPETGFQFGLAMLYSFYLNKGNPETQRNSTLNLFGTFTTQHQYRISVKGSFWTKDNLWHISPTIRYSSYPNYFYGIGDNTDYYNRELISDLQFKIGADAERRFLKHTYVGSGLWFEHEKIGSLAESGAYTDEDLYAKTGGRTVYLPIFITYDSRDVVNYPYKGEYARLRLDNSLKFLGSDFNYTLITLDIRKYHQIVPELVIAGQFFYQTLQGADQPFYLLPQMGNDEKMRGYYTGRYRDQTYITTQAEVKYRPFASRPDAGFFSLSRGVIAIFTGFGSTFANGGFKQRDPKPDFGIGARYIFDQRNRLTLRLDYGIGDKPPGQPRNQGFYLALNEAF